MDGILIKVGQFPVYIQSLFVVLAFLWFGFVIYKKGVEYHYKDESLLDLVILSGVFGWIMARLFFVALNLPTFSVNWLRVILLSEYPGYSFAGLLIGVVLANVLLSYIRELKPYEGLDLSSLGLAAGSAIGQIGLIFGGEVSLLWQIPKGLLLGLIFLVCFVWLYRLEREYRTFEWYRYRKTQARSGFIFGSFLVLFGISIGIFFQPVLGILMFIFGIILIYYRSGRVFAVDIRNLIKKLPIVYTKLK